MSWYFREHGESQEVELFYGVNGDFAYKYGLADHTIEEMSRALGAEPMEPCILVCQKRTLKLQNGVLDVEELWINVSDHFTFLRPIQEQSTDPDQSLPVV